MHLYAPWTVEGNGARSWECRAGITRRGAGPAVPGMSRAIGLAGDVFGTKLKAEARALLRVICGISCARGDIATTEFLH